MLDVCFESSTPSVAFVLRTEFLLDKLRTSATEVSIIIEVQHVE